jgi:hypothetical protein
MHSRSDILLKNIYIYYDKNLDVHNHDTQRKLHVQHVQNCNTVIFKKSITNVENRLCNKVPDQKIIKGSD